LGEIVYDLVNLFKGGGKMIFKTEEGKKAYEQDSKNLHLKRERGKLLWDENYDYLDRVFWYTETFTDKVEKEVKNEIEINYDTLAKIFEEKEKEILDEIFKKTGENCLTAHQMATVIMILFLVWRYGDELLKWWNRRFILPRGNNRKADQLTKKGKVIDPSV